MSIIRFVDTIFVSHFAAISTITTNPSRRPSPEAYERVALGEGLNSLDCCGSLGLIWRARNRNQARDPRPVACDGDALAPGDALKQSGELGFGLGGADGGCRTSFHRRSL